MDQERVKHLSAWVQARLIPGLRRYWGMALGLTAVMFMLVVTQTSSHAITKVGSSAPVMVGTEVGYVFQVLLGLAAVLLLIIVAAWLMRRVGRFQGGAGQSIRVLGGVALGARDRMVLVQVGEQQILMGVSPGRLQTLLVLDKPIAMEEPPSHQGGFAQQLTRVLTHRGGS